MSGFPRSLGVNLLGDKATAFVCESYFIHMRAFGPRVSTQFARVSHCKWGWWVISDRRRSNFLQEKRPILSPERLFVGSAAVGSRYWRDCTSMHIVTWGSKIGGFYDEWTCLFCIFSMWYFISGILLSFDRNRFEGILLFRQGHLGHCWLFSGTIFPVVY